MEAVLRAKEFQETVDANSEGRDLTFQEWMKKVDEAANNKREKLAKELADAQEQSRAMSQDEAQNTDAAGPKGATDLVLKRSSFQLE
jgi:hypothetical protein